MRKLILCSFLLLLCICGISIADTPEHPTSYYKRDNLLISLTDDKIPNDESQYVIEEQTDIKNSFDKTQY